MKKLLIISLCLAMSCLFAQTSEVLSSDRPGQTFSANTVGKNVFQIQSGFGYDQTLYRNVLYVNQNFASQGTDLRVWQAYNATDLRYGIIEPLEVGLTFISSYDDIEGEEVIFDTNFASENNYDTYLSLRYNLVNFEKWVVGFRASGLLSFDELNLRAMASYSPNQNSSISSNVAYRLSAVNSSFNQLSYTLNFAHSFNDFGFFLETFAEIRLHGGEFQATDWQNFYDMGIWYLVNNNLQLDLTIGTGFNDQFYLSSVNESSRFFVDLGFTYRIK